jgi:hypothetical protein
MIGGMRRTSLALALIASLLSPAGPAAAKCAPQVLTHQVVSHAADVIPAGGGVLVGWDSVSYKDAPELDGDPAARAGWRFKSGKKRVATTMVKLAPGLALYRPTKLPRSKVARRYLLIGDKGARLGTFKFGGKRGKALAAPEVASVTTHESDRGRGRAVTTTVTLSSAPPADAYGLVVRAPGGEAFAWGPVVEASLEIRVFHDDGRCGRTPPDMRAAADGEALELLWVDRFGRLSAAATATATR